MDGLRRYHASDVPISAMFKRYSNFYCQRVMTLTPLISIDNHNYNCNYDYIISYNVAIM